ncbi:EPS15 homology domain 1 [Actinidia rufa]|uniref:EPS15 homology domain 1 n=1 Tax=Actinidia rufa TaxID=165716 RepID=A0A7J0G2E1_9ERIC|nr:EPS15 homology domain 1 [Actinidia rufa]
MSRYENHMRRTRRMRRLIEVVVPHTRRGAVCAPHCALAPQGAEAHASNNTGYPPVWAIADSKRQGFLGFKEFIAAMQKKKQASKMSDPELNGRSQLQQPPSNHWFTSSKSAKKVHGV